MGHWNTQQEIEYCLIRLLSFEKEKIRKIKLFLSITELCCQIWLSKIVMSVPDFSNWIFTARLSWNILFQKMGRINWRRGWEGKIILYMLALERFQRTFVVKKAADMHECWDEKKKKPSTSPGCMIYIKNVIWAFWFPNSIHSCHD